MDERAGRREGFILLIGLLLAKILGAVYRIPLTNLLGAEGIGYYQLVFPVYAFIVTLTSGAYPTAISKILNGKEEHQRENSFGKLETYLKIGGLFGTVVLVAFSGLFAKMQGKSELAGLYCLLAPSVTAAAVIAGIKGWFQSKCDMRPSGFAAVFEQVFKLIFGLTFVFVLRDRGVFVAVAGAVGALTLSEFLTLGALSLYGIKHGYPRNRIQLKGIKNGTRIPHLSTGRSENELYSVVFPMTLSGLFPPLTAFIDSLMLISLLEYFGVDNATATKQFGLYSGAVLTIINLPIVLTLALSAHIVPYIAEQNKNKRVTSIRSETAFMTKTAFFICTPPAVLIGVFAEGYLPILYSSFSPEQLALSAKLLAYSAATIPFSVLLHLYGSILNALSREKTVLFNTAFMTVVKLIFTVSMTLKWGVYGIVYANLAGTVLSAVGLKIYLSTLIGRDGRTESGLTLTAVSAMLSAVVGFFFSIFFKMNILNFLLGSALCVFLFVTTALLARVFDENELTSLFEIAKINKKYMRGKNDNYHRNGRRTIRRNA